MTVNARDWMQIKTELDDLRPADAERPQAPATDQDDPPVRPQKNEDSILRHIADALRREEVE